MRKIKVFIVEDSILMQKIITDILLSDSTIEVIGTARYGKDALERIPEVKPDIVTLDINLPDIDGLNVLRGLVNRFPVKVVMISAYTQKGAETTIRALELGALDFIPKPSGEVSLDLYNFKDEIVSKIKLVDSMDLKKSMGRESITYIEEKILEVRKLVVIGASTGGPKAIMDIMSKVSLDTETSFLIVQHMPKEFTRGFAERISWYSSIRTKEGEEGDPLLAGAAYVAPGGYHMVLEKMSTRGRYNLRLDETPLLYTRPAVDVTMKSVADTFEGKIIAVILTGMGRDGLEGVKSIKSKGGKVIVQDEFTSVVYGMPKVIVEAGLSDVVLPLGDIPRKILYYLTNG